VLCERSLEHGNDVYICFMDLKRHLTGLLAQNDGSAEAVAGGLEGSKVDK
jgi:hypothetical protein